MLLIDFFCNRFFDLIYFMIKFLPLLLAFVTAIDHFRTEENDEKTDTEIKDRGYQIANKHFVTSL